MSKEHDHSSSNEESLRWEVLLGFWGRYIPLYCSIGFEVCYDGDDCIFSNPMVEHDLLLEFLFLVVEISFHKAATVNKRKICCCANEDPG